MYLQRCQPFRFLQNHTVFKANLGILILIVKITANNDFKMVPGIITGVTSTSTPVIPDHR